MYPITPIRLLPRDLAGIVPWERSSTVEQQRCRFVIGENARFCVIAIKSRSQSHPAHRQTAIRWAINTHTFLLTPDTVRFTKYKAYKRYAKVVHSAVAPSASVYVCQLLMNFGMSAMVVVMLMVAR